MSLPLTNEQLEQLPSETKDLLQAYFSEQSTREQELRTNYERLRIDAEQKYFELERQQLADQSQLELQTKAAADLRWQVSDLEKRYGETSEKYRELQSRYFEKVEYWNEQEQILQAAKTHLESEKYDLNEMLNKRNREVDRLTEEWKTLTDQLSEMTRLRILAQNEAGEAKSERVIIEHRENRLKQELESLKQQNEWLTKELQERTNELMTNRKEKTLKLMELQYQLDDSVLQASQSQRSLETMRRMTDELSEQNEQYIQKLKDARDSNAHLEDQYRQELLAQEKLLELYKVTATESEEKAIEMTKAVEELQKLLKQATDVYNELQAEKEEDNRVMQELIVERESKIKELEKELSNANELLEVSRRHERQLTCQDDAEIVSSAAANVSRLLKSGMTLTQIYSEYVQAFSSLQTAKDENRRLSDYLDRILKEIEEKAPLMKKQREDYEKCLETIDHLTCQLDTAMLECQQCRVSSENDRRRCAELTRENGRYKQETFDLSRQVRLLLKELEEARGTVVHMHGDEISSGHVSSSSNVITERLVTFRSIEELQEQNQRLLAVVRKLSDEQEQHEMETDDNKCAELQRQLDDALKEIEEMKEARQRQVTMVESIVQQRDTYRMLATQPATSPKSFHIQSTPLPVTPVVQTSHVTPVKAQITDEQLHALEETKNCLKELQEEFSVYRREKGENERLLNEQLERTSKEVTSLRVQNARLASQLDFTGERIKVLQSNAESNQSEIEALRDKNTKLMASLSKYQQSLTSLQEELISVQDKLTRAEVRCQNLMAEKEIVKSSEARLTNEIEMMHRNQQSRDQLIIRLEAIQNNLERSEFETKTRLGQQMERLERENSVLRKKLDGTDDQQKAFVMTLERQLNEARQELDRERLQVIHTAEQLSTAQEHVSHLKQQLTEVQAKLDATQSKLTSTLEHQQDEESEKKLEDELKHYSDLLADANHQIACLESKVVQAEQHAAQYKTIAGSVETTLREQNAASEQLRQTFESQIAEIKQENEMLEEQVRKLEATMSQLTNVNTSLANENAVLLEEKAARMVEARDLGATSSSQLAEKQKQLDEVTGRLEEALLNEQTARQDCERQAEVARTCQQNYQRELTLHAADVENLRQAKQQLEGFTEKLDEAKADAREARSILSASQASWVEQEQGLRSEIEKLRTRLSEIEAQNTALHQELEKMSARMIQLQTHQERESEQMQQAAENVENTSASSEQLLEVIRFLRREKELAEARFEVIQAETNRLRQQTAMLKKQADAAEQALADEREKAQVNLQTAAQHAEMMRKVETLNLLQDSNQLLREERTRLVAQLKDAEASVRSLEEKLRPLEENCRDVTAQRDAIQKEVDVLQSEMERWKSRTNHLIEQCNKFDPEEHKRAIEERDQSKKQLTVMTEEMHKQRAESSRLSSMLRGAQTESEQLKQQVQTLSDELNELKSNVTKKDAELDEKNNNILQLRKIGRKYRMQAEEVQKELDELKKKNVADQESSQSDTVALRSRVAALEREQDEITIKLGSAEHEKYEAVKKASQLEQREQELTEQLTKITEEHSRLTAEIAELTSAKQTALLERDKEAGEKASLEETNASLTEEKKKMVQTIMSAKQRLLTLRTEKEHLEKTCTELRQSLDAATAGKETGPVASADLSADERLAAMRSEMQSTVTRLETELGELQQSRSAVQQENQQHLEALDRLRRENTELTLRIQALQSQLELSASKQTSVSPAKPTISAPPVERTASVGGPADQQTPLRKANIRPMASQQPHVRTVQPVRGAATETRAMASIRPMAAAMMSSSSNVSTPMATVMPTTAAVSESESSSVLVSAIPQSVTSVQMQARPTQQVQPVSSHFEEATVSSSEEQSAQTEQMQPSNAPVWWHMDATPSTSSERDPSNHGASSGPCKRPRDDLRTQEDGSTDTEADVPAKRSKQTAAEVADTTETTNSTMPPAAENEREAASVAQTDANAEPTVEVRRESEPVTTSLSTEEHSRMSYAAQEDDSLRPAANDQVSDAHAAGAEQDYHESGETAASDYDRPSTSRSDNGTPESDEGHDDNGDAVGGEEYQQEESEDGVECADGQDEVVLVEDDDDNGDIEDVYGDNVGEGYQGQSGDEAEQGQEVGEEEYPAEESEDYETGGDIEHSHIPYDVEEGFEGELVEDLSQSRNDDEDDDDDNDAVIIIDPAEHQQTERHRAADESQAEQRDDDVVVTTSLPMPQQTTSKHIVTPVVSVATAVRSDPMSVVPSSSVLHTTTVRQHVSSGALRYRPRQNDPLLAATNRAQLMPFIFGADVGGFELENDGIVPSTPTLQLPQRSDGFAEAVCSPQVHDERFMFGASGELIPHSQLAHQEGVDDTRMDLSQFDEAAVSRSMPTTPHSPAQPEIYISAGDDEELEQIVEHVEGTERGDMEQGLDLAVYPESAEISAASSRAASPEDHLLGEESHAEVGSAEHSKTSSSNTQEEQPSTSSGSQADRGSADKQDGSQAQNKPKIQRIVWEDSRAAGSSGRQHPLSSAQGSSSGAQSNIIPLMSTNPELSTASLQRRGGARGFQLAGSQVYQRQRPSMSQSNIQMVAHHRQPGSMPPRHAQVARRARGRGAGPRGFF